MPLSSQLNFDFIDLMPAKRAPRPDLPDRLYFALKPPEEIADKIVEKTGTGPENPGQRAISANCLHISLLSLGDHSGLPETLIAKAKALAAKINAAPVEIAFDHLGRFGGNAIVLRTIKPHPPAAALRRQLLETMSTMRLVKTVNNRSFAPHMTVFYDHRPFPERRVDPVCWTARNFVLVHSLVGKGHHKTLGSWPLSANTQHWRSNKPVWLF